MKDVGYTHEEGCVWRDGDWVRQKRGDKRS